MILTLISYYFDGLEKTLEKFLFSTDKIGEEKLSGVMLAP